MLDAPCSALAQRCCSSTLCVMLLLFAWCCYSLFDTIVLLSLFNILCCTLLFNLSLFNVVVPLVLAQHFCSSYPCSIILSFSPCSMLLLFCSFLDVATLLVLTQHCCSSTLCSTLLLLCAYSMLVLLSPCSTLLFLVPPFSLLDIVAFLLFVQLYYSSILARHYCSSLLAWHCSSCAPCSMLWFLRLFVFNIACSHSNTSLLHHDVATLLFLFPCSMLMLLYSLLNVVVPAFLVSNWYFPLVFLQGWEELSKFNFFRPNVEGEVIFQSLFVDEFFYYPCFWEILINNVFVCCVQELFGHYTFNFTHCVFF
jgi:hypothetical protein